jgi:UTP--glucose-1-phosphate uridylyltransferase
LLIIEEALVNGLEEVVIVVQENDLEAFHRKTDLDYARNNMCVPGLPNEEYLNVLGMYVIKPQLFEYLEGNIRNNLRERGEFQFTTALDRLRQEDGLLGLIMGGKRFDIGLPIHFLETVQSFGEN